MPNGESKNWIRFQLTLESFYVLYGKWPTTIRLCPFFIDELQERFSPEDFQKLQSKIKLIPDQDNSFLAYDELGNRFDYVRGTCPRGRTSVKAIDWLQISEPDYYD